MTTAILTARFLRFVPFAVLDAWGYAALFADKEHAPLFPTVPLRELITHRKGFIRIDDSQRYKRCRVQLRALGVVLRDEVLGSAIKTKQQQVCRAGDFLVAEIDAKLKGFGIVPPDLDGAVVSSHYFLFNIHEERLSREYLALCLRTDFFQRQVQATGSTNYAAIRPYHVLGYTIPLPPLTVQERLVAAHRAALKKADAVLVRAREREQEAARSLETALGLQAQSAKPNPPSPNLLPPNFTSFRSHHSSAGAKSSSALPQTTLQRNTLWLPVATAFWKSNTVAAPAPQ